MIFRSVVMNSVLEDITQSIGNTPLVKLRALTDDTMADIYVKLEFMNPGSSVKDRVALAMLNAAEEKGLLEPSTTIVEATSGNTGVGIAMVAASKGYKALIVMPETNGIERRKLLKAYGAEVLLTPADRGMKGAIEKANEFLNQPGYYMPQQFENEENPKTHERTTGKELVEQTGNLNVEAFVAGVGTGGTISGVGRALRKKYPDIHIAALEPESSAVLSGGTPSAHQIQGIGAGFVPVILDLKLINRFMTVSDESALLYTRKLAEEEGLLCGISSGANVYAAVELAKELGPGKSVLTILSSGGERYLSTNVYALS